MKAPMIPIARPCLDAAEAEAAVRVIQSGWLTQGPEVAAFEQEFATFVGAPFAVAVSNCTTALHLALLVAGVEAGDEVITVSHSFIATANAVRYTGAEPVFVDVEAGGYNIDPGAVERAITPRTRAILCVHQMGMPCDLERIVALGRRHGITVIEDAACAIGSEICWNGEWQRIGRPHGDLACFSFHPRKIVTTGDGGMITCANPEWNRQLRLLRQHGMNVPDTVRHGSPTVIFESYDTLGFNYRMTDLQAAVGRVQLRKLPAILEERRALAAQYAALLAEIDYLVAPVEPSFARSNWQSYPVRLRYGLDQRQVMQTMLDHGIATRRGIMCAHRHQPYAYVSTPLPHSEAGEDQVVLLPLYSGLSRADQTRIIDSLVLACDAALAAL
jgi:dTDP-4-amino-4,6-dideoxygalactose transaminase